MNEGVWQQIDVYYSTSFLKDAFSKFKKKTDLYNGRLYIYNISVLTVNIEFMWRGLETGERRAFSESFQPFRAKPHKFYIYHQYTNNVFILQYTQFAKKNVIWFNNKKIEKSSEMQQPSCKSKSFGLVL